MKAIIEPSGEKCGKNLNADAGGEAVGVAAVAADDPEIAGIVEDDLRLADGGKTQQERRIGLGDGGLQEEVETKANNSRRSWRMWAPEADQMEGES